MRTRTGPPALLGLSLVVVAALSTSSGTADASRAAGILKLVGAPALIDKNIGNGAGKHHFDAVIQVKSTFRDMQNVTVEFDVMQGGKVVHSDSATAGIRPGGGVVSTDVVLSPKATSTVRARFTGFAPAFEDDVLAAARIAGTPRFIRNEPPLCSMSTHLRNPAKEDLDADVYFIGLRQGTIVASGNTSPFDDVKPGASVTVKVDFISCVKVDEVRAFVEGDGL
jgi:hypothetical protein